MLDFSAQPHKSYISNYTYLVNVGNKKWLYLFIL